MSLMEPGHPEKLPVDEVRHFPGGDLDNPMQLVIGLSFHSSAIENVDHDAL